MSLDLLRSAIGQRRSTVIESWLRAEGNTRLDPQRHRFATSAGSALKRTLGVVLLTKYKPHDPEVMRDLLVDLKLAMLTALSCGLSEEDGTLMAALAAADFMIREDGSDDDLSFALSTLSQYLDAAEILRGQSSDVEYGYVR